MSWPRRHARATPPGNTSSCGFLRSEIHFERVEPADVVVDRINHLALINEYIVDLDRTTRRAARRFWQQQQHQLNQARNRTWLSRIAKGDYDRVQGDGGGPPISGPYNAGWNYLDGLLARDNCGA